MKTYETYIFDLDGTLLNTLNDLATSTNYALRQFGIAERNTEEIRQFVGNGVRKLIERAVPEGERNPCFEEVYRLFKAHYQKHSLDTTLPYEGIIPMLKNLKAHDKKIAVVSNKFYDATQKLCRHFFNQYIEVAIGEREDIRKKPAPDIVFEALKQLHADKNTAVYVGDSDVDILTARNCGIPCISVLWGFRDQDFLKANGGTTFVKTPQELVI